MQWPDIYNGGDDNVSTQYRDLNGKIVIDATQAAADIKKLKQAREKLEGAKGKLARECTTMQAHWIGDSKDGFNVTVQNLNREIDKSIAMIDAAIRDIEKAVATYRETDRQLSIMMKGMG